MAWSSLGLGFSGSDSNNRDWWSFPVTGNPGEVLVLCIAKDTTLTGSGYVSQEEVVSVSDEGNNSWTKVAEYVSAHGHASGTLVAVFFTKATNSPGNVFVSFSYPISSKAAEVRRFAATGPVAVQDYVGLATNGQPEELTLNVPTGEYLWLRAIASRHANTETWNHTSGYTGFNRAGTSNPPQSIGGEFIIATGSSQTSNPTTSGSARRASLFIAFKETTITKSSSDASALSVAENLQLSRNPADSGTITSVESETTEKRFTATDAGTLSASAELQLERTLNDAGTIAAVEDQQVARLLSEYDSGILSALEGQSLEVQRAVNTDDAGTLSAVEAQSLEARRDISETDASTLEGAEQLALARDPADAGILLSDEAIVFERAQADAGTISAAEAQSLEIQHDIDETDAGTLLSDEAIVFERAQDDVGTVSAAEVITVARTLADAGTLLSDEAIVFERTQADVGTISAIEAVTLARVLADAGTLAAEETANRSALIFVNAADTGVLAGAEAQGTSKFALKAPPALRVTNYLRRTV